MQTYSVSQTIRVDEDVLSETEVRRVYSAVLLRMLRDAVSEHKTSCSVQAKRDARRWLTLPNPDFDMVCWLADLDPEAVRGKVQQVLQGGMSFLAGGKGQNFEFVTAQEKRKREVHTCM